MPQTTTSTNTPRAERRSHQWWFEQVQAWQSSGLSAAQFGATNGLRPASLYRWASRFRQPVDQSVSTPEPASSRSTFVQALVQPEHVTPGACALTMGDVTVRFDAGLAPAALAEWVRVLRALPC